MLQFQLPEDLRKALLTFLSKHTIGEALPLFMAVRQLRTVKDCARPHKKERRVVIPVETSVEEIPCDNPKQE